MSSVYLPTEQRPRDDVGISGAQVAVSIVALIGVVIGAASLFLHGWAHATISFVPQPLSGASVLQQVGVNADQPLVAIADQEVRAVIAPTMWQYMGHIFQWEFALLMVVAALLLVSFVPRIRVAAHVGALLASLGAATIILIALVRIHDRLVALPDSVLQTIQNNILLQQSLALTTGKPMVDGGPGWPIFAAVVGVALVVLGTFFGLLFALVRRPCR